MHQLTATLDNYEPVKEDIEVRRGMVPEIDLKLKPSLEIAALSVQCDPSGASILLDGKPPVELRRRLDHTGPTAQIGRGTRLNSSHTVISYAVFCLKKKNRYI